MVALLSIGFDCLTLPILIAESSYLMTRPRLLPVLPEKLVSRLFKLLLLTLALYMAGRSLLFTLS
jgi:hypothetical protein